MVVVDRRRFRRRTPAARAALAARQMMSVSHGVDWLSRLMPQIAVANHVHENHGVDVGERAGSFLACLT